MNNQAIPEMNNLKIINEQDAVAQYCLSSIRAITGTFTAKPLIGMVSRRVSAYTGLETFSICKRLIFAYTIPVAAVSGAVVVTYLLGSSIKYTPNLFLCAVVLSSWLGDVGAGIFSILLSVVALDYYFLPPIYALGLTLEETPDMVLFVTVGLFVNWINRQRKYPKKSIGEEGDRERSVFREKNHGPGKTDDLLRVDRSNAKLTNGKLDHGAPNGKDLKKLNRVPNLTATKAEADEVLRHKLCTGEPGANEAQVASRNGSRSPLRNPPKRRSGRDAVFYKRGDYWTIQYEGEVAWLKATRGLDSLACLLRNPGREFHVRELVGPGPPPTGVAEHRVQQNGHQMRIVHFQDTGPILDAQAKAEYKFRLAELREELKDAERFNDDDRAGRIQQERDAIAGQLAAAIGLGRRDRKAASQAERARSTVTKRVRNSIEKIKKATPRLGRHLAAAIKTGYFCSYLLQGNIRLLATNA